MRAQPTDSPKKQRSLLLLKLLEKKYSGDEILQLLREINLLPEEKREEEAKRIRLEMEKA